MAAIPGVPPSAHDPPAPQTQSSPACGMAREEPRVELGGGGGGEGIRQSCSGKFAFQHTEPALLQTPLRKESLIRPNS